MCIRDSHHFAADARLVDQGVLGAEGALRQHGDLGEVPLQVIEPRPFRRQDMFDRRTYAQPDDVHA